MRHYHVWMYSTNEDIAIITHVPDEFGSVKWKLNKGISCKDWFPDDLILVLNPSRGKVLTDAIHNTCGLHVVNEKLKNILESSNSRWEFFQVGINNHKGKLLKEPYYVANLLGKVWCVNRDKSICHIDPFDDTQLCDYDKLVLDEDKISPDLDFFRLGETPRVIIIEREIAKKIILDEKCTGAHFANVETWDGFGV